MHGWRPRLLSGALQFRMQANIPTGCTPYLAKQDKRDAREEARLEKQRRERMTAAVVRILDKGEPTRFVFEGAVRHGLRSGFCLDGTGWAEADALAASIIKDAMHRLGMTRPTWEMGQPESAQYGVVQVEYYYCAHCGGKIDHSDSRIVGKKYCSARCRGSAARRPRDQQVSRAEYLARITARPIVECDHCGKPFDNEGKLTRRFCSRECSSKGLVRERPTLTCEWCSKRFQLRFPSDERRFCSNACAVSSRHAANRAAKPKFCCKQCGRQLTKRDQKTFCSRDCANEFRYHQPRFVCEPAE